VVTQNNAQRRSSDGVQVLLNGHNEDHMAVWRENFHYIFIRQFVREPMFYFLARAFDHALSPA
jgi:hypothetical protein